MKRLATSTPSVASLKKKFAIGTRPYAISTPSVPAIKPIRIASALKTLETSFHEHQYCEVPQFFSSFKHDVYVIIPIITDDTKSEMDEKAIKTAEIEFITVLIIESAAAILSV